MKIPQAIKALSLVKEPSLGPYPPLGFIAVADAELGNGDYFGLYWPLGKENSEPVVCDMIHDESMLSLEFSNVDVFVKWLELNDYERDEQEVDDDACASTIFHKAQQLYRNNSVEPAIELLEQACHCFGEISEYWFALATQSRRIGNDERAAQAALKAFQANWMFGCPEQGVIAMLKNPRYQEYLQGDPVISRMAQMEFDFGGQKHNPIYPLLKECVNDYFNANQPVQALLLYQNYAYMMRAETSSFQERYEFDLSSWQSEFGALCAEHLGSDRKFSQL
ncbi:tetratricopeptide repeat-containing protein [Celerinatantimonas sp. MCCC 1A17872]|uniref:tetratricopeptide repeat-containing protein n=1 Tax=Celerinatantimonas sp. MCCC 1A17872 TaxID=3177514 RepID=UPI0038C3E1CE